MNCPQCSKPDVIEIEHILPDGTEVRFFACHNCEEKYPDEAHTKGKRTSEKLLSILFLP